MKRHRIAPGVWTFNILDRVYVLMKLPEPNGGWLVRCPTHVTLYSSLRAALVLTECDFKGWTVCIRPQRFIPDGAYGVLR